LFNLFIEEATGLKGPFPYKRQLEFDVEGLPGLLAFRKPSGYGTSLMKSILQCKDQIKFKRKEVNDRSTSTFTTDAITITDPVSDPTPTITQTITTQTLSMTNINNPNTISDPSSLRDHVITSDQNTLNDPHAINNNYKILTVPFLSQIPSLPHSQQQKYPQ
jgi:hypothetical protein